MRWYCVQTIEPIFMKPIFRFSLGTIFLTFNVFREVAMGSAVLNGGAKYTDGRR